MLILLTFFNGLISSFHSLLIRLRLRIFLFLRTTFIGGNDIIIYSLVEFLYSVISMVLDQRG